MQFGCDEQVLLAESKRNLAVLISCKGVNETADMRVLNNGILGEQLWAGTKNGHSYGKRAQRI